MEKLLLVGAGGFGRVVLEHASQQYACAFLDDGEATLIDGVPVIGKTSDMAFFYPEYKFLLVTIGNNELRERLYKEAATIGFTFPKIIHPSAYVSPHAHIGTSCMILNNAVGKNNSRCGDRRILNPSVELYHHSTIACYCVIYTNSEVRSLTLGGICVWIESTVTISTLVVVPDDATIEDGEIDHAG